MIEPSIPPELDVEAKRIVRAIPPVAWDASVWPAGGAGPQFGILDVADVHRLVRLVLDTERTLAVFVGPKPDGTGVLDDDMSRLAVLSGRDRQPLDITDDEEPF